MYPLYRRRNHWEVPDHWSLESPEMLEHNENDRFLTPAGLFGFPEGIFKRGYPVNIHEENGDLVVEAELPGFDKSQVEVSVDGDVLRIHAVRKSAEPKGARYLTERSVNVVNRSLRLPAMVDESRTEASLEDGVLKIRAPKVSGGSGSKISVK
jgi:HSP20 family protein